LHASSRAFQSNFKDTNNVETTKDRASSLSPESESTIPRVSRLYDQFCAVRGAGGVSSERLRFAGVDGKDVYNITAPFLSAGTSIIAGRVEPRDNEFSNVVFFEERDATWYPVPGAPQFELQDPFVSIVQGEFVFGGVRVAQKNDGRLTWHTVFFRGADIFSLNEFFVGPRGMKDIRLCDMRNGRIGVFTRPQGTKGGRGTIGYTEISCLEELSTEVLAAAPLIEGMFHPADWGGVNETHLLAAGEIGVLAHAAFFERDDRRQQRHYYATAFIFSPSDATFRNYRIIASRDQFLDGPAKRPDLTDIIFSSGLVRTEDGTRLYAGVSDAEAHWITIPDPF
jgi:hypothetical protein